MSTKMGMTGIEIKTWVDMWVDAERFHVQVSRCLLIGLASTLIIMILHHS